MALMKENIKRLKLSALSITITIKKKINVSTFVPLYDVKNWILSSREGVYVNSRECGGGKHAGRDGKERERGGRWGKREGERE
jgi:hypothetical protein